MGKGGKRLGVRTRNRIQIQSKKISIQINFIDDGIQFLKCIENFQNVPMIFEMIWKISKM